MNKSPKKKISATSNSMLNLYTHYGRTHHFHIFCGIIGTLLGRFSGLLPALFLGLTIDLVFFDQSLPSSYIFSSQLKSLSPSSTLILFSGIIALSFFLGAVSMWIGDRGWNAFAQEIQHALRTDTYDALQSLSMNFFEDARTGELLSIINNDVNQLEDFLSTSFSDALRLVVMVIGVGFILFLLNPELTIVAMFPVPIIAILAYLFVRNIHPKYVSMRSSVGGLTSRLEDNLSGIEVINTESTKPYEKGRVSDSSSEYYNTNWAAISTRIKFFPLVTIITGIGFVLTFTVGGLWVLSGPPLGFSRPLTPGTFVTFVIYVQQFVWPIAQFGQIVDTYQRAKASNSRIFDLLNQSSSIVESPEAVDFSSSNVTLNFNQVSFRYPSLENYVLKDISFQLKKGETLGIVGASGSGKTTLVKLLARLYDVDEGSICIEDQNIQEMTLSSLRKSIAYVSQDSYLFSGTLRENIKYGQNDATEQQIIKAAKTAQIHEFISTLPDGYDTQIGERGVTLSGGQRQRVALARALVKQSPIFVIDEATRYLDTETESNIRESLSNSSPDRITIVISHRLASIHNSNKIIVLEDGKITTSGTHEDLLQNSPMYASLWKIQSTPS
jgi:ATP-binding cassette subfamily B protein